MVIPPNYLNKYTQISSILAEQIAELIDITETIKRLRLYSEFYTEKYRLFKLVENATKEESKGNDPPDLSMEFTVPMQGIAFSIILTYCKFFDKNSKARRFPLDEKIFKGNLDLLSNHNFFIDTRNGYIAHDDNMFDTKPGLLIGFDEIGNLKCKLSSGNSNVIGFKNVEKDDLFPLLDAIDAHISIKLKKVLTHFNSSFDKIIEGNIVEFFSKLIKEEEITETDMYYWSRT